MFAPRWPVILIAAAAICLFACANLARPIVIPRAIDEGLIEKNGSAIVVVSLTLLGLAIAVDVFQAVTT